MRFHPGLRRFRLLALVASGALSLVGCTLQSQLQAYPGERIGREEVMGTWENGEGETVEFRDDQTFTVTGEGQGVPDGRFDGEWDLCYDIEELEEKKAGDPAGIGECEINSTGHWITMSAEGIWQGRMVVAFEEDVRLYLYAPGEGRDDDFFTEV